MSALVPILVLTALVLGFGTVMLVLTSLVGPKEPKSKIKLMPYECGIRGEEKTDTKISVKFYLTAILFILFDIEVIFLFPWALVYRDFLVHSPVFIFAEMMVFIAILLFGLFYVIKAKALEWE